MVSEVSWRLSTTFEYLGQQLSRKKFCTIIKAPIALSLDEVRQRRYVEGSVTVGVLSVGLVMGWVATWKDPIYPAGQFEI